MADAKHRSLLTIALLPHLVFGSLFPLRPRSLALASVAAVRQAPVLAASSFAAGVVVGSALSSDALETFQTAADVPNRYFKKGKTLRGTVVKVADGDTLRVRHRPLPLLSSTAFKGKLSDETIQVRIIAVDAPEIGKFGSKSQPFAEDARDMVDAKLRGRTVAIKCIGRDRFGRLLGSVRYGLFGRKDLSSELLRSGLAVVYRGSDGEYGDRSLDSWSQIEARAKQKGRGMWKGNREGVSPSEYKRQQRQGKP
jgi:micrococcal nuclease